MEAKLDALVGASGAAASWYAGRMGVEECEQTVVAGGNGSFLVRRGGAGSAEFCVYISDRGNPEEVIAAVLRDVLVALRPVVVASLGDELRLELLLVDLAGGHADLDEHLYDLLDVDALDGLAIALTLDLGQK